MSSTEEELIAADKELAHLNAVARGLEKDARFQSDPGALPKAFADAAERRRRLLAQTETFKEFISNFASKE